MEVSVTYIIMYVPYSMFNNATEVTISLVPDPNVHTGVQADRKKGEGRGGKGLGKN